MMKYISIMLLCCFVFSACTQSKLTPSQSIQVSEQASAQVELVQNPPLELKDVPKVKKSVYAFITRDEKEDVSFEKELNAVLKGAGYSSTLSPSEAGYVLLLSVVYMGPLSQAETQAAAKQDYESKWKSPAMRAEDAIERGLSLVVDVRMVVRTQAEKVRNNTLVVSTASLNTAVDECHARVVAHLPFESAEDSSLGKAELEKLVMQKVAKALVQAL